MCATARRARSQPANHPRRVMRLPLCSLNEGRVSGSSRLQAAFAAGLVSVLALLAGCGSSSKSSSSSLCNDVDSLQSSVQQLKSVDVAKNGTSSLQSALDKVKSDASAVANSAKKDFKPQVDALQSALQSLSTALENVRTNGVAPVQQAAQSVEAAQTSLQSAVKSKKCS